MKFLQWFKSKLTPQEVMQKYGIPERVKLDIKVTSDGWFLVSSPDLPGLLTQARTAQELLEMVDDAILTYFDVPTSEARTLMNHLTIDGYSEITRGVPVGVQAA